MTLHGTTLPKNTGETFQEIEGKINTAGANLPNVIAKYREEIMDVLKSNEAIDVNDENTLNGLIGELKNKKALLETDLGKTPPCKIDLSDNSEITNFWKSIVDDSNPKLQGKPGTTPAIPAEITGTGGINDKIQEALEKIQFLHDDGLGNRENSRKLFKGASTEMTNISKTLKNPLISTVLNQTDATKVDNNIKAFVNSVRKTKGNAFYVQSEKLYTEEQREIAIRMSLYLYCAYKIANDSTKITKELCDDIKEKLDQIIDNEIPKIKGLHNTKVELGYLEPEYETLRDLNTKRLGDIDLGTHNLIPTKQSFVQNLTTEYEAGIATGIEKYELKESDVSVTDAAGNTYPVSFLDAMGNTGDLFAELPNTKSMDFRIEVGGNMIKIGKLVLSNLPGNANFKIEIDDDATINSAFGAAGVTLPAGPISINLGVKGIKKVNNKLKGCCAALKRSIKIALATTATPPPVIGATVDVQTSISNVTEVSREEAERVAEEQLRERYEDLPRYSPDRINLFFRRDYIKEKYVRKIMDGEKGLSRKDRDTEATDRQQIQKSQDTIFDAEITTQDIETRCPITYSKIDNLCKNFMGTPPTYISTVTDDEFQRDFNDIINHNPPFDNPSVLKLLGKERALTYSSNILFRMKMFVSHQKMVNNISSYLTATPPHSDAEIEAYCRTEIKTFMDSYNELPRFLNDTGLALDDPNFVTNLKGSTGALTNIAAQTMKLKMQIMQKGSAAYKIKQKRGLVASVGNALDSGHIRKKEKQPLWLLETLGWGRGLVKTGVVVAAGVSGGMIGGPLGTALATGGVVGLRTLFSKYSHYTKEHEGQMKNEAVDLANYEAERSRLQSAVSGMHWYEKAGLWGSGKKDARHWNRYVVTTHGISEHTTILANNISALANRDAQLSATETNKLKDLVSEGFARLMYYKKTGQNFLGSDDVNKAEEDYRNLYAKLISGAKRLGWVEATDPNKIKISDITARGNYTTTMNFLESGYKGARKNFESKRAMLGWGNAVVTGAVAGGLSYLTTKVGGKKVGRGDEHNFNIPGSESSASPMTNVEVGGGTNNLHDVFQSAMASNTQATGYNLTVSPEIDAIPTGVGTSHTYSSLQSKILSIKSTIPTSDTKTLEAFDKAMALHSPMPPRYKRSALEKAIAYASNNGADVGNQYLFGERFAETVKDTLAARASAGTTSIPIDKIVFGKGAANAAASTAGSAGSLTERSMNGVLTIKGSIGAGVPLSRNTFKRKEGKVKPGSISTP